uniref:AB hydrolase-1 domain-containing protein n=1 Tax=Corethron hystrix TaxID=216773 RepID=A0A7S1BC21_9STRA|mmetsp:Transcript_20839/g.47300  ORF Transcript_20839/g.47300 Transcript_20839/m.47300 type:complete len:376 (+) Transcript_20839:135-1262(+)|eukprot:CAMPEP_0113303332 /NCGR_PEP_ID=MMETSP0010_2-20120614/3791_1 /TAXON_ID=216773 ORGANISM="Corethron hystrix, Strain 308" /NCGR_SAMPLE_ID=MMETSP0010_2 /ASSEMBLY_ACC=CAM_ASM_000155 /LENGTH=375 /DNA_ID=CAMNT_0000157309 /DNA_START=61 /DNA_END=1188 /DNA_ORIENTATION=- /assembly_acc=CAM_ASM_000155
MKDEYGEMTSEGETFVTKDFDLENGTKLPVVQLKYKTYGKLNNSRDNVLVVCHALTGNASLHSWWGGLLGKHKAFDTEKYLIVCCNIPGSCYGSTNPQSVNPNTGTVYGKSFPDISVKDTVKLQLSLLQEELNILSVKAVIGGSFGGMQALEFAVQAGSKNANFVSRDGSPYVRSVVAIACGATHTAWQIAVSEVQRQAIYADPKWKEDPFNSTKGLEVARQMAMVSYRTPQGYQKKFGRQLQTQDSPPYGSKTQWKAKSYLEHQGKKFIHRFDPITYVKLTEQMDSHDISRNRGVSVEEVLGQIKIPVCVLGIDSDVLYPLSEQEELVKYIPDSELFVIRSDEGHDGFLLEQDQVAYHITKFLNTGGPLIRSRL